ncbi:MULTISPECIES: TetR/AcrR family transcriptional regulator [unclassified Nodularia (in: cyanobacteria)]|uniref:TetR/AcrR family transcriptional regulator n=1 Tax=unclassified Nodularia (in: cyanobacteria) TaxID=2656917 RepID=UPI00187F54F6|nr:MULTISPECIES: TetR/AcrR family transcriptional regulator [unclassified Nodularia (in: cyanobacteria)]MBE9197934.1 TetR/AcrR family transcriptional regulator [Nodularia sp. LEGE 06071]MCC2693551.1 TetR/AcrR family transcriptional regulator [Nodularia sp. LEGE 04288]
MSKIDKKPGRPRSVESHQAILQATLALLAEIGFDAMSIEAIAARAGVGKTTIYRRYASKEELMADAIENMREEVVIPNTGNLWGDIDALIENASQITLSPLGRQTVAMIISSASSNSQFAQIYWTKYLQPRRQAFTIVLERAKARNEVQPEIDSDLVFDIMSGVMLYTLIFPPTTNFWEVHVRRCLNLVLQNAVV